MDKKATDFNIRLRTISIRDLLIGSLVTLLAMLILTIAFPIFIEINDLFTATSISIIFILFIWALRGTHGLSKNLADLFTPENQKDIWYVLILNILYAILFTCLISSLDLLISLTDPTWISIWDLNNAASPEILIMDIISAILIAPIIEELIFRGVLFNRLKIRIGIIPAMLLSSGIFAIGHEFGGMTSAFLFGICMCILYLKTDNILVTMTIHFLNNVFFTTLEFFDTNFIFQMPFIIPITLISVIATLLLLIYMIKETSTLKRKYS